MIVGLLHLALGEPQPALAAWWSPMVGMVLWAPVFLLLDRLRLGSRG